MWGLTAPLPAEHDHHGVVLVLSFYQSTNRAISDMCALFVSDDGQLRTDTVDHLRVEWRFNWNTHTWEDSDLGDFDDQGSDGSPEIPGDIPAPDGTDRSDPGDQGDGAIGSVVSE